jgi:hypothetical protein
VASISIGRRRKAWEQGVICGATGRIKTNLVSPKLREIFERGVEFGKVNAETPSVKAIVAAKRRPAPPPPKPRPNNRFNRRPSFGNDRNDRNDRPGPFGPGPFGRGPRRGNY